MSPKPNLATSGSQSPPRRDCLWPGSSAGLQPGRSDGRISQRFNVAIAMMRDIGATPEPSGASPWTRAEDGYMISICKEKDMRDWRNELRGALPGRIRREILKRLWYLGIMMKKVKITNSEGDDLGAQMRCYVTRNAVNLSDGGEDEADAAEATAHLEAYQRAAESVPSCDSSLTGREVGAPADFDFQLRSLLVIRLAQHVPGHRISVGHRQYRTRPPRSAVGLSKVVYPGFVGGFGGRTGVYFVYSSFGSWRPSSKVGRGDGRVDIG
jgi:hypothetical protein